MVRRRKQLARDAKTPSLSSSSSPLLDLAAAGRARRDFRAKQIRMAEKEGPQIIARLRKSTPSSERRRRMVATQQMKHAAWQKEHEAKRKIVRAAKAKLLRKRIASKIAKRKLRAAKEKEARLRQRLSQVAKKTAARKIVRALKKTIVKRKRIANAAAVKIQKFYRAREALRRAEQQEKLAVAEQQVASSSRSSRKSGSGSGGGGGGGGGVESSSRVPKSIRKVLARLIAHKKKQRMVKRKLGSKRCPKGYRRMRKTRFCGTKSLLKELPRLRRKVLSPGMDAPKSLILDTHMYCPKGYKRVRKLNAQGAMVRTRKCKLVRVRG
jgi:hypothetical protein